MQDGKASRHSSSAASSIAIQDHLNNSSPPSVKKIIDQAIANSPARSNSLRKHRKQGLIESDGNMVPDFFSWKGKIDIDKLK